MPLDGHGRVNMPTQWVYKMIEWAADRNVDGIVITFPKLLSAIENEGNMANWKSNALTDPDQEIEIAWVPPNVDEPDCILPTHLE